jgi:hypothetical protein
MRSIDEAVEAGETTTLKGSLADSGAVPHVPNGMQGCS